MSDTKEGVARLRELLFDRETAKLETVDQQVADVLRRLEAVENETAEEKRVRLQTLQQLETLLSRAGSEERFQSAIASVLDRALTEAEVTRQPELSRALAPLVVQTIKSELRNSQDEMVEALYPITGRLVQSYVAGAMKDLADQINRRLEQNAVMLRLRSWTTGRSVADLAMADTQRLHLDELYLIRRGSGELLARWPSGRELSNSDVHMSGLMTAITDFATEAFGDNDRSLRAFEREDSKFFLRASPTYLLAAKCSGHAPASVSRIIDQEFVNLLSAENFREDVATTASPEGTAQLTAVADKIKGQVDKTYEDLDAAGKGYGLFKVLLFLIALPIFAWVGWSVFTNLEEARVRNLASTAIEATAGLTGYKTELEVGYRGQTVSVSGLTPDADVRRDLVERLRRSLPATTRLETELGVLPNATPDARPLVARLRRQLARVEVETRRAALERSLVRSQARLSQALSEADVLGRALEDQDAKTALSTATRNGRAAREELAALTTRVGGLAAAPRQSDLDALRDTIASVTAQLRNAVRALPTGGEATSAGPSETAEVAADTSVAAEDLSAEIERYAGTVTALRQFAQIKPVQPKTIVQVQKVEAKPTPDELLERWARRNAVFFANGVDFRDPDVTERQLDELAELLKASGLLVRVVGFTDERGGLTRNNTLALERARQIYSELRDRGVPADRMVAVGRAAGRDLSPAVGEDSPNRRVEFEIGFIGEAARSR
ncbi:MAG: OmpA family protein [Pseudomonadota bacterium]